MNKLKKFNSETELDKTTQKQVKGGGWGNGSTSNGNGCPPPSAGVWSD